MSNTLSFGIDIKGAPQAQQQLRELLALQAGLDASGRSSTLSQSPQLLAQLKQMVSATVSNGRGLGSKPPIIPPVIGQPGFRPPGWLRQATSAVGGIASGSPFGLARAGGAGIGFAGAGGAGVAAGILIAELVALTVAFRVLKSAVEDGAKLYQHAAKLGMSTGKTFQLEALAKVMGLSSGEIDTLALRGSHPQRGERQAFFRQGDLKTMLGSGAGAGQIGGLQQIKNMGDYADRTFRALANATKDMASNAKAMQEIFFMGSVLGLQLKSIFVQLATALFPLIKKLAEDIYVLFTGVEWLLRKLLAAEAFAGLIPKGDPGQFKLQASRGTSGSQASPWERMGFVIGGFAHQDYAKQTAENTAEVAKSMKAIVDHLRGPSAGSRPPIDPMATHTFYHKISPLP